MVNGRLRATDFALRFAGADLAPRLIGVGRAACAAATTGEPMAVPVLPSTMPTAETAAMAARLNVSIFLRASARDTHRIVGRFNKGGAPMAARRGVPAFLDHSRSSDLSAHTCTHV